MRTEIAIAGALAQKFNHGGFTWFFLQYVLGFQRLGYDVLFLDRLEPDMCVDESGRKCPVEMSVNLRVLRRVLADVGLQDRFCLIYNRGEQFFGLSKGQLLERVGRCAFLLNVMGYLNDAGILGRFEQRVFLDIDPGFGQMWKALGLCDTFAGHNRFVTLGENLGRADCAIPACGLNWITTRQPVVLDRWPVQPPNPGGAFTSIGAWRGPNAPIEYKGRTYGLRVHEFRKFVRLPALCPTEQFEMAFDIHPGDARDMDLLKNNGWALVQPKMVAGTPRAYQEYIVGSKAEFMVPKQMYIDTTSGLLSDRSVYYLASGRPVVARDTGIKHLFPTGEGLLTFTTLEEAATRVEAINRDYPQHARAARRIAEGHFDSDKVLSRLLKALGVG
jgi:hypothetical protein